jgi:hypothetical protein
MIEAYQPVFDIQIGDVRFSKHPELMAMVRSVSTSIDVDKVSMPGVSKRGKKRAKRNGCMIIFSNQFLQLNNILRFGRKIQIWMGYKGYEMVRVGVYNVENPRWIMPEKGLPELHMRGSGGDVKMAYSKEAMSFSNLTLPEIIKKIADKHGLQSFVEAGVFPRITVHKGVVEDDYEFSERLAWDHGMDLYIDSSTDPNTIRVERVPRAPVNFTIFNSKQITIGWGEDTPATFPAQMISIDYKFPETTSGMAPQKDNKGFNVVNSLSGVSKVFEGTGLAFEKLFNPKNSTPPGKEKDKVNASAYYGGVKRVLQAKFVPGVPYFKVNQFVPLVGMDDLDGIYRVISVANEISVSGFTTTIGCMIGGGETAGKKDKSLGATFLDALGGLFKVFPMPEEKPKQKSK